MTSPYQVGQQQIGMPTASHDRTLCAGISSSAAPCQERPELFGTQSREINHEEGNICSSWIVGINVAA